MLEFAVANLVVNEDSFEIPGKIGKWKFDKAYGYKNILEDIEIGKCGNTFYASIDSINMESANSFFQTACNEIIDICLILSFLTARCVGPTETTANSDIQFMHFGDSFVQVRAIEGFSSIAPASLTIFFSDWVIKMHSAIMQRRLRLHLCHWLSGLTCFTLEDIYLSAGVQMDMVKQLERAATGTPGLNYFQGMMSAATRYSLTALGNDFKAMRNDIVHEGVLSGINFPKRTKGQCASVIAETLNWLDSYILAVIGKTSQVSGLPRWKGMDLEQYLPSISVK